MQAECSWNTLQMPFNIFFTSNAPGSFDHEPSIQANHKNEPECTSNVQECAKNFHSDSILPHSPSSVTGVLLLGIKFLHFFILRKHLFKIVSFSSGNILVNNSQTHQSSQNRDPF